MDVSPWPGLAMIEPASDGSRSEVWRGLLGTTAVSVRRSLRSAESLAWELDLMQLLGREGFVVPEVIPSESGHRSVDGVVVQRWLEGRAPNSVKDWHLVADELQRLHGLTGGHAQRPDCSVVTELRIARRSVDADLDRLPENVARTILAVFENLPALPVAVIHGDTHEGNIRLRPDGAIGLLDWDESRVDVVWHDLSNLGVQVLGDADHREAQRLSNAWEAANGWMIEPDHAEGRFRLLADAASE